MFWLMSLVDFVQYIGSTSTEMFWILWKIVLLVHFISSAAIDSVTYFVGDINARKKIKEPLLRATTETLINLVLFAPIFLIWFSQFMEYRGVANTESMSIWITLLDIVKVAIYICAFDIWFELSHRLLHNHAWLFACIHSQHHSYTYTIATNALAMHPVEFLFVILSGFMIGPLFFPPSSAITLYVYSAVALFANCVVHSRISDKISFNHHVLHHTYPHTHPSAIGLIPRVVRWVTKRHNQ